MELAEARAIVRNIASSAMLTVEVDMSSMSGAQIRAVYKAASVAAVAGIAADQGNDPVLRAVARAYLDGTL